jgi:UDP-2-acetamido-2,6-beta-L-arabino-hexul-4-ose reductase
MKVLITGAKGFIGQNLCFALKNAGHGVYEFDRDSSEIQLKEWISSCDFIVHLAGINRPINPSEFFDVNVNFTKKLLNLIIETGSKAPIIFSSSTQAELDNPYGKSKKLAEEEVFQFSHDNDHPVFVFRLYNVFGKWCKPNYNSVIATWCYNVAHDVPLEINEKAPAIDFVFIDDVCDEFIKTIEKRPIPSRNIILVEPHYSETLHQIADLLQSFKNSREDLFIPLQEGFSKKLYATYLTYLEPNDFRYSMKSHFDNRGSFTEFLKTIQYGQISLNVIHSRMTKGNHYHNTKNEKYWIISGTCVIKLRDVRTNNVLSFFCSDKDMQTVDIPPGFVHSITNSGENDAIVLIWASEFFDSNNTDTFPCLVDEKN